jgi:hypothetical protein
LTILMFIAVLTRSSYLLEVKELNEMISQKECDCDL